MENSTNAETSKSIFRNVLYGFSTWILPLGLSFIATSVIVKTFGNAEYGIYTLILSVIGYTFNLSFGRAATKYIAEYRASGEVEKIRDIISHTFFINIGIGLLGATTVCASAQWLVTDVFEIGAENRDKTIFALYVAALILFSLIINQVFNAILQGFHRFDVYSKLSNLNSLLILSGNILLAYNNYGIVSLLWWNLLTNIFCGIIFLISAKRLLPEFGIRFSLKTSYLKLILGYSAGIIGYQILANILLLFERIWITRQLGTENLTFYVIPMSLAIFIHGFISSIILVIFPLASELSNDREKLLRLYTKATKVVCFFVVFLGITLTIESRVFLTLWLGADFAEKATWLLITHTVTFSLLAILSVSWQMTEGLGYPSHNTYIFVICLVINVGVIILLTPSFGNQGVALGRLAGFGTIFFSIFYVEKWFFKCIQTEFWLMLLLKLGISAVLAAVVEKIIIDNFEIGWAAFIISTACGGAIYCLSLLVLGFVSKEEKLLIKNLVVR